MFSASQPSVKRCNGGKSGEGRREKTSKKNTKTTKKGNPRARSKPLQNGSTGTGGERTGEALSKCAFVFLFVCALEQRCSASCRGAMPE